MNYVWKPCSLNLSTLVHLLTDSDQPGSTLPGSGAEARSGAGEPWPAYTFLQNKENFLGKKGFSSFEIVLQLAPLHLCSTSN